MLALVSVTVAVLLSDGSQADSTPLSLVSLMSGLLLQVGVGGLRSANAKEMQGYAVWFEGMVGGPEIRILARIVRILAESPILLQVGA